MTEAFVKNLANRALPWQEHQLSIEIDNFLNSLTDTDICIKSKGGQNDPHYNIYMDSKAIKDDQTGMEIHKFLKARAYPSPLYGRGLAKKHPFYCVTVATTREDFAHSQTHQDGTEETTNLPQILGNAEPTLHQSHAFRSRPPRMATAQGPRPVNPYTIPPPQKTQIDTNA